MHEEIYFTLKLINFYIGVLKVLVKDGDVIKKGDNLLVLEAMKMENSIKANNI